MCTDQFKGLRSRCPYRRNKQQCLDNLHSWLGRLHSLLHRSICSLLDRKCSSCKGCQRDYILIDMMYKYFGQSILSKRVDIFYSILGPHPLQFQLGNSLRLLLVRMNYLPQCRCTQRHTMCMQKENPNKYYRVIDNLRMWLSLNYSIILKCSRFYHHKQRIF